MEAKEDKKKIQLGMNPSTASHKLVKDILWRMIVNSRQDKCYQCGELMTRATFSIEHKEPWLDSDNPVERFFDLENISFSHLICNCKEGRRIKLYHTASDKLAAVRATKRRSWQKQKDSRRPHQIPLDG